MWSLLGHRRDLSWVSLLMVFARAGALVLLWQLSLRHCWADDGARPWHSLRTTVEVRAFASHSLHLQAGVKLALQSLNINTESYWWQIEKFSSLVRLQSASPLAFRRGHTVLWIIASVGQTGQVADVSNSVEHLFCTLKTSLV